MPVEERNALEFHGLEKLLHKQVVSLLENILRASLLEVFVVSVASEAFLGLLLHELEMVFDLLPFPLFLLINLLDDFLNVLLHSLLFLGL